jgi:hypothetical protein
MDVLSARCFVLPDVLSCRMFCPSERFCLHVLSPDVLSPDFLSPDILSPDVLSGHLINTRKKLKLADFFDLLKGLSSEKLWVITIN